MSMVLQLIGNTFNTTGCEENNKGSSFVYKWSSRLKLHGRLNGGLVFLRILVSLLGLLVVSEMASPGVMQNCCHALHWVVACGQVVFELVHNPNHILWKMNAVSALLCSLHTGICFSTCSPLLKLNRSDALLLSPLPQPTVEITCHFWSLSR